MISFESDYNNGMLPEILEALGKTNGEKHLVMVLIHTQNLQKRKSARLWTMRMQKCSS